MKIKLIQVLAEEVFSGYNLKLGVVFVLNRREALSLVMSEKTPLPIGTIKLLLKSVALLRFVLQVSGLVLFNQLVLPVSKLTLLPIATHPDLYPVFAHFSFEFSLICLYLNRSLIGGGELLLWVLNYFSRGLRFVGRLAIKGGVLKFIGFSSFFDLVERSKFVYCQ